MIDCNSLEGYLENRLDAESAEQFEMHLAKCDRCLEKVKNWQEITSRFSGWVAENETVEDFGAPHPALFVASIQARMNAQSRETGKIPRNRMILLGALAAAACVFFAVAVSKRAGDVKPPPHQPVAVIVQSEPVQATTVLLRPTGQVDIPVKLFSGKRISTARGERSVTHFGADWVGIAQQSAFSVSSIRNEDVTLRLEKGSLACRVGKRKNNEVFTVLARDVVVAVVGTRFSVTIDSRGVRVTVDDGMVRVARSRDAISEVLVKGEAASITAGGFQKEHRSTSDAQLVAHLLSAKMDTPVQDTDAFVESVRGMARKSKQPPETEREKMERWQNLIIAGQFDDAFGQIGRHLKSNPADNEARMLLSTCLKKMGNPEAAVKNYRVVISAGGRFANRARYLAGEICQEQLGDHLCAVSFFRSYVAGTSEGAINTAEARLRMARSLLQLNEKSEAHNILNDIVAQYGHTNIATRARKMLEQSP